MQTAFNLYQLKSMLKGKLLTPQSKASIAQKFIDLGFYFYHSQIAFRLIVSKEYPEILYKQVD